MESYPGISFLYEDPLLKQSRPATRGERKPVGFGGEGGISTRKRKCSWVCKGGESALEKTRKHKKTGECVPVGNFLPS